MLALIRSGDDNPISYFYAFTGTEYVGLLVFSRRLHTRPIRSRRACRAARYSLSSRVSRQLSPNCGFHCRIGVKAFVLPRSRPRNPYCHSPSSWHLVGSASDSECSLTDLNVDFCIQISRHISYQTLHFVNVFLGGACSLVCRRQSTIGCLVCPRQSNRVLSVAYHDGMLR